MNGMNDMNELVDAVVILVLVLVLHGPMLRFVKDLSRLPGPLRF
jgi:hypothetical protein